MSVLPGDSKSTTIIGYKDVRKIRGSCRWVVATVRASCSRSCCCCDILQLRDLPIPRFFVAVGPFRSSEYPLRSRVVEYDHLASFGRPIELSMSACSMQGHGVNGCETEPMVV